MRIDQQCHLSRFINQVSVTHPLLHLCEEEVESAWLCVRKVGTVEMSTREF